MYDTRELRLTRFNFLLRCEGLADTRKIYIDMLKAQTNLHTTITLCKFRATRHTPCHVHRTDQ